MSKETEVFIVCVDVDCDHHDKSVIVKCWECRKALWCSAWNQDKKPICIPCALGIKNAEFGITDKDLAVSNKEIKRRKREK